MKSSSVRQDHIDALVKAERILGRTWRSKLQDMWMNGNYQAYGLGHVGHLLQQIRNEYAGAWIYGQQCKRLMKEAKHDL